MARMSADERRESVIRAAMHEFARGGYYGTSTEAIAKRVGVSQPYLFRLFPNKQAIFLAAAARCLQNSCDVFAAAAEGLHGEEAAHAIANAYTRMIAEEPEMLQMQLQMYVTVAAAEAAGDHELGELVRAGWMELWDTVHVPLGGDVDETTTFMAYGMLINTLSAMGFPPGHRVWEGLYPSARVKGRLEK
ncbi:MULTISPECIES: TetR/AcrR family transcriptional regulator [unclassified Streptomyces]|uniref:TetR/AcrR family transcriptional regulator n=1 Tax=unclassified Streptomyces TaxID=2593676 RepID=UPI001BE6D57C|nr:MULTISPECIES: TetR/AcrR family transcriptional regulator [unclassified Streptomyces]MBT2402508.1 TetR/AcrR family transcriptional regulator [Streptomyces sp. ISL-21]MBT2610264.1 TetR/AcrR family transcriptional regulator [Streptomyces sp. ISL-87]